LEWVILSTSRWKQVRMSSSGSNTARPREFSERRPGGDMKLCSACCRISLGQDMICAPFPPRGENKGIGGIFIAV
jgi:hypothetical protein